MSETNLSIAGSKFLINGALTYSEIEGSKPSAHGLLMNARFIQGIFDSQNREQFNRYGRVFNPEQNTDNLIAALPEWYAKGLRAITVGMQGGGSCYTVKGSELKNNPFSADGLEIDSAYLGRLDRLIKACDRVGMVVIVSLFYGLNTVYLNDAQAVINIVKNMAAHLRDSGFNNIIIEIANEHDLSCFEKLPVLHQPQGIVSLIEIIKSVAPSIPVGCSGCGGYVNGEVCRASDVVLLHGNTLSRSQLYNLILKAREYTPDKPIVINEDSQAIGQLAVCEELSCSWGYYNNMTKQEPPTYWEITKGEDEFFAWRMADMIGIKQDEIPLESQYYLQGFEPHMHHKGLRFPRVASLYPESIDRVRFYHNGEHIYTCYDESFTCGFISNWDQKGVQTQNGDRFVAEVVLRSGEVKKLEATVNNQ